MKICQHYINIKREVQHDIKTAVMKSKLIEKRTIISENVHTFVTPDLVEMSWVVRTY